MLTNYRARRAYKGRAAVEYDSRRTATKLGRLIWNREFTLLRRILSSALSDGGVVLDAPAGTARFLNLFNELGYDKIGVDISMDMLQIAKNRQAEEAARLVAGNCESLPLKDDVADYVVSMRFMGHLPPNVRVEVLREFKRVCRKGIIVGFPVLNWFTSFRYRLGNIRYRIRTGMGRSWYPVNSRTLADELSAVGLEISRKKRLLGPFDQIVLLHLSPTIAVEQC